VLEQLTAISSREPKERAEISEETKNELDFRKKPTTR